MIGGTDVVLWIRDDLSPADVILRTIQRHWPNYIFQNGDDPAPFSHKAGPWLPLPTGREFFVYENEKAAHSWHEHGAIPENTNTMLYVILGNRRKQELALRSLTLVCGNLTGTMKAIIADIDSCLRDCTESLRLLEAA